MSFVALVRFRGCRWCYLATVVKWDEQSVRLQRCVAFEWSSLNPCRRKTKPRFTQRNSTSYARERIQSCERADEWTQAVEMGHLGPSAFCVTDGDEMVARNQAGNVVSGKLYLPDRQTIWQVQTDDSVVEKHLGEIVPNTLRMFWYCST